MKTKYASMYIMYYIKKKKKNESGTRKVRNKSKKKSNF